MFLPINPSNIPNPSFSPTSTPTPALSIGMFSTAPTVRTAPEVPVLPTLREDKPILPRIFSASLTRTPERGRTRDEGRAREGDRMEYRQINSPWYRDDVTAIYETAVPGMSQSASHSDSGTCPPPSDQLLPNPNGGSRPPSVPAGSWCALSEGLIAVRGLPFRNNAKNPRELWFSGAWMTSNPSG
eukprot:308982-Amorphochlora_amoeboformis.AAC.1